MKNTDSNPGVAMFSLLFMRLFEWMLLFFDLLKIIPMSLPDTILFITLLFFEKVNPIPCALFVAVLFAILLSTERNKFIPQEGLRPSLFEFALFSMMVLLFEEIKAMP